MCVYLCLLSFSLDVDGIARDMLSRGQLTNSKDPVLALNVKLLTLTLRFRLVLFP